MVVYKGRPSCHLQTHRCTGRCLPLEPRLWCWLPPAQGPRGEKRQGTGWWTQLETPNNLGLTRAAPEIELLFQSLLNKGPMAQPTGLSKG